MEGWDANLGPRPRSEHAIVFSRWPCELLHMFGVSAKLRAMVGLQSAESASGVWKALIKFAQFDHVFAIPIFFAKVCLV